MNKKFLSVILFSALMVGTAGTFTSCKDYDDDIERIDNELTGIKSTISELQAKVDEGKYVTNVAKSGDGIVITWNDNSTSTIETIKGDKGDKVEISIDPTTKNWIIDGVDTGICAEGKSGNGVNAKSPSISETTGNWVVYEWDAEKQEYVGTDTGVSAKGANAYVVDMGNYYELNVAVDKAGSAYTTVKLPKYPTTITEIEFVGTYKDGVVTENTQNTIEYDRVLVGSSLNDDQKKWNSEEGVKQIKAKQIMSSLDNTNLLVRVAPAALDASQFSFTLINSLMQEAPVALDTPEAYNELLTRATVSGNGLWIIPTAAKEGETYNTEAAYDANFTKNNKKIAFALKEGDNFVTNYGLTFAYKQRTLTSKVGYVNGVAVKGSKPTERDNATLQKLTDDYLNTVSTGEVTITFENRENVYDAHLHFDDATKERFGINYDGEGTTFEVTKRPDDITAANFQVRVHYVVLREASAAAKVKDEFIPFRVMKSYGNVTELASQNILITPTEAANAASYDLSQMYADLSNVTLWKADVAKSEFKLYEVTEAAPGYKVVTLNNPATLAWTDASAALNSHAGVKVQINDAGDALDPAKQYYYMITYKDAAGDVLNEVKVPFTISLPTLDKIFVEQDGVFDHSTHTAAAWLDGKRDASKNIDATYSFTSAFNKLTANLGTTTFKAALDNATEIVKVAGAKKTSADLATLSTASGSADWTGTNVSGWNITLKNNVGVDAATKTPAGYGKDLIVKVSDINYLNKYNMGDASYTFKINVKSPLLEGKVVAVNGEVTVPATEINGYQVNGSHIEGYTYNDIKYSIFKDKEAANTQTTSPWKRKEIKTVEFASEDTNIFTCDQYSEDFTAATGTTPAKDGYVTVYPKNVDYTASANMTVKVTDAWGYVLTQTIKVTVEVGE